jgi:hypothetical protein
VWGDAAPHSVEASPEANDEEMNLKWETDCGNDPVTLP